MTVKANKAQLRFIAEELVAPLMTEMRQQQIDTLARVESTVQDALRALAEERTRVGIWRQRIEAEHKDIRADLELFRAQVAEALAKRDAWDRRQDEIDVSVTARIKDLDRRTDALYAERVAVSDLGRQIQADWQRLDGVLQHQLSEAEALLHSIAKKEMEAISAAGKHTVQVAVETRAEAKRAESSVKAIASGALKKLRAASG